MWPQKWNASARCALNAAAITPLPLTASSSRAVRARKPRRELFSATASLSTHRTGRVGEQALELVERVESALGEDVAVRGEDDRIRAPRDRERTPDLHVVLLVEELDLDLRVGRDEPQRRFERRAERAARRRE